MQALILIIYLAPLVYLFWMLWRLVRAEEKIADKLDRK
jgi:threonine/homoserine/homoserine lactone efflux protein